jgi:hypothetical protein
VVTLPEPLLVLLSLLLLAVLPLPVAALVDP